ncbi:NADH dehydrogenase [ubiquinone] 1 alpha subcomplex assembly factor 2 [Ailuropoda melanoleuca]|uniref:NADH dehydrogenase [ubiquinone] 1 alpha subcomplex assembly factor 2 n=1 Tax=Ailuropoda melanoleuca TaxID=9646 RepID=UPI001493DF01|nr:NADH dehydrogenase [ubiquinone] 1 alpha subcomplex assembly factor 2 [Ailuropoda melanoleuca]
MRWSQDLFRALWRALSKEAKQQVGKDQFGNKYYYVPEYKNWRGQTIREKRIVEAANKREVDYEVGAIPTEWEAWIRKTRKTPPTMEPSSQFFPSPYNSTLKKTALLSPFYTRKLRHRECSDTEREILKNEKNREEIKIKNQDLYEKEKLLRKGSNEELLASPVQTQIKGHASAPYFGKEEPTVAPTSTGKTFQPGSWMPQGGKNPNQ